jgi:hypothetical protein
LSSPVGKVPNIAAAGKVRISAAEQVLMVWCSVGGLVFLGFVGGMAALCGNLSERVLGDVGEVGGVVGGHLDVLW